MARNREGEDDVDIEEAKEEIVNDHDNHISNDENDDNDNDDDDIHAIEPIEEPTTAEENQDKDINEEEVSRSPSPSPLPLSDQTKPRDPPGEHANDQPQQQQKQQPTNGNDRNKDEDQEQQRQNTTSTNKKWYQDKKKLMQIIAAVVGIILVIAAVAIILRVVVNDNDSDSNSIDNNANSTNQADWFQRGMDLNGNNERNFLGSVVALSDDGNVVAAGAEHDGTINNGLGYVRVWQWQPPDSNNQNTGEWAPRGFPFNDDSLAMGFSVALNGQGNVLALGVTPKLDSTEHDHHNGGIVQIWEWTGLEWRLVTSITDSERNDPSFGNHVALDTAGQRVAIAARDHNQVQVWQRNQQTSAWEQLGQTLNQDNANEHSEGTKVALSANGNFVAVANSERVSVWELKEVSSSSSNITAMDELPFDDHDEHDNNNNNITSDRDAQEDENHNHNNINNNSTAVDEEGTTITQIWSIRGNSLGEPSSGVSGWSAGGSVALSSTAKTVALGVSGYDDGRRGMDSGRVIVWEWTDGRGWLRKGDPIHGEAPDEFAGFAVDLAADGNTLAVGAPGHDGRLPQDTPDSRRWNSGNVRVFEWNGSTWRPQGSTILGEGQENESAGRSVALSQDGTVVAVGAPFNDNQGFGESGSVRVHEYRVEG